MAVDRTVGSVAETICVMVSTGTIRMAGLDVAYDRAGSGPPLVLVHGAAGDAREWHAQMAGLSDAFTVIAWDEPGAGRSSDVPADFGLAGYATALAALVETLGAPAHVCGLSWGGTVTLELYRRRPQLVATLVLADTYAGWKGSLPENEVRARVAGAERMLAEPAETFHPTFPGLFAADPPAPVIDLLNAVAADVRRESLRVALAAMVEADLRDVLPGIAVPTLLIWGELDARSPLSVAREFARVIPHAELVVIPGAGHMSNLERPEEFNAAIRAFCGPLP
jgi:pimeloyl-ACP methyl ester carboxylesterase